MVTVHPTAEVDPSAVLGEGTRVWHQAQIRENASLGANCVVGKDAYIDHDVRIGDGVKIQNGALIYYKAILEDGVFIGPNVCLTNDRYPRAISPDGQPKSNEAWDAGSILVRYGASIGAGAIVLPDVTIGRWALVAAGAIVSRDVPEQTLVAGCPAKPLGYVCKCGRRLKLEGQLWRCYHCNDTYALPPLEAAVR